MRELRKYANDESAARGYINEVVGISGIHGIAIDVDTRWYHGWVVSQQLLTADFQDYDRWLSRRLMADLDSYPFTRPRRYNFLAPPVPDGPLSWDSWVSTVDDEDVGRPDYRFRPEYWRRLTERLNEPDVPFLVRVSCLPGAISRDLLAFQPEGVRVRIAARNMPRALSRPTDCVRPLVGGLSIGPASSRVTGTLGGILTGPTGRRFGLTCAHVIDQGDAHQPAPADGGTAAAVGKCVAATPFQPPQPQCAARGPFHNELDAALIELDTSTELEVLGLGPLNGGMRAEDDLYTGLHVDVVGKESGHQSLRLGGLNVTQQISINGQKYCFAGLIELKRLSRYAGLTGTFQPPVKLGDSGAWVTHDGANGREWCGVAIAGESSIGYATAAELVMDWLQQAGWSGLGVA